MSPSRASALVLFATLALGPVASAAEPPAPAPPSPAAPGPVAPSPAAPSPAAPAPSRVEPPQPSSIPGVPRTSPRSRRLDLGKDASRIKLGFDLGKGFRLSTGDDTFSLAIRARAQVRYDLEQPHRFEQESEHLFQIRRARLVFAGHAFGEHNKYYVQLAFSPRDMTGGIVDGAPSYRINPLRDMRLELDHLRDLTLVVGQMKVPFSRQRVISSGNLEMVDRSLSNEEFQLDRDVGVQLLSRNLAGLDLFTYSLGLFMGEGRNVFDTANAGFLWVARVEALPFGPFDDYSEADLARSRRPGLSLGVAYAFHDDAIGLRSVHGARPRDGGTTDYHHLTADLLFKHRGFSVFSAFHLRDGVRNPGDLRDEAGALFDADQPRGGIGALLQLGYLLPWVNLQPTFRWSAARNVFPGRSSQPNRDELGGGLSYYIGPSHSFKVQADYFRTWEGAPQTPLSTLAAQGNDRVRLQIQLAL